MAFAVYLMFFDTPAKGVVDVAVTLTAACLFDAYFAQAVSGIVMVILGTAGGLFAAGTSVFVVAVFQSAEAEQLIKTDQVLIAFFFAASSVQQVGRSIVLQGFPVCFIAAAFDVLITSVIILNLPD
uniref:hypothetical protein n=1 Tax=Snodgrassella alvi TaxID=1196083 RepID=UPI003F9C97A4